jgi:branched-chain amino acid transport system substrate-binding protein
MNQSSWMQSTIGKGLAAALFVVVAAAGVGCGSDDDDDAGAADGTLTLYSSLPLQGAARDQSDDIINGIRLALEQANGKAGKFRIKHRSLDDSSAQAGTWTAEATSANARRAVQDESAIAYIGESNSGASAISMPFLNEGPLAQLGINSAVGLTQKGPGADAGEPDKYYPSGERHYFRLTTNDLVQGAALAEIMELEGCTKLYILNDKELFGAGLAAIVEGAAPDHGMEVLGNDGIDIRAPNFRAAAAGIASAGADCFLFAGITANNAVAVFKDVAQAIPDAKLFGGDGLSEPGFYDPAEGGLPPTVAKRVLITLPTLPPSEYPPAATKFFADYREEYGEDAGAYAIYGYESAKLVLDTIRGLGDKGSDREALIDALFATTGRESVLGTYDVLETGDTTLTREGIYGIEDAQLKFRRVVEAER